ncbi:MAG: hypothetical protein K9G44_13335 [Melioribacteraceae bacterium]|nr:hypothetical protein [Melioribacteraceae bacterium]
MKKNQLILLLSFSFILTLTACSDNGTEPENDTTSAAVKFAPADGECLFILGQADTQEMAAYVNEVNHSPHPAGFAFYTSLSGSAIQTDLPKYKTFMDNYPNTALQLAIWTGERRWGNPGYYLDEVLAGDYDANIIALADACKGFGKPIYIRFGYEFDGWHNAYPPDKYIAAYKYFVDKMRANNVTNVAYVWHSWGVGAYYGSSDFPDYYPDLGSGVEINQALWYPGDDYVDWVGLSIFGIGWGNLNTNSVVQYLIDFAEDHGKAVMLAETAAIKTSNSSDPNWVIEDNSWFTHVFSLIALNNSVKAFTYINTDWEGKNSSSTWGDTRIQVASQAVKTTWIENIPFLLHAEDNLYTLISYP